MENKENFTVLGTSILILIFTVAAILVWDKWRHMDMNLIEIEVENIENTQ